MTTTWPATGSPAISVWLEPRRSRDGRPEGKACLVTGGSRGIGRAIALELGRRGASVAVGYRRATRRPPRRSPPRSRLTAARRSRSVATSRIAEAIETAVASVVERFGKIDVLVNNAGITRDRSLAKMSPEEWDAVSRRT